MNQGKVQERQSNIELLRIVAMLMIITFHVSTHCIKYQLTNTESIAFWRNGLFNTPAFFPSLLLLETLQPLGKAANAIFMLITGFFMISRSSINLKESIKKVLIQYAFATCLLVVVSACRVLYVYSDAVGLLGISIFNSFSWFAGYYIFTIICAALFINKLAGKLSQQQYLTVLLALFAFISHDWLGSLLSDLSNNLRVGATGVFLYMLGGYIKKYDPFAKLRATSLIALIVLTFGFVWISYYNKTMSNINTYHIYGQQGTFIQSMTSYTDYSIVCLLLGICLFEIGRRIRIPSSKVINFVSKSTFMIYLLHDNNFFREIWKERDWITLYYNDLPGFCSKLVLTVGATFAIGFFFYLLYLGIERVGQTKAFRAIAFKKQGQGEAL